MMKKKRDWHWYSPDWLYRERGAAAVKKRRQRKQREMERKEREARRKVEDIMLARELGVDLSELVNE